MSDEARDLKIPLIVVGHVHCTHRTTTGPKRTKIKPDPQHYECSEGNAILVISDKRHQIRVLLDSGSNIFLLNQNTAPTLKVPYEIREKLLKITAFNGEVSST